MKDYNRWTDKEHKYKGCVDCTYRNCQYCDAIVEYEKEVYNRLAERFKQRYSGCKAYRFKEQNDEQD